MSTRRRYRLYLETSFWSRLGDRVLHARRKATERFLRVAQRGHEVLISTEVLKEVKATPDRRAREFLMQKIVSAHPAVLRGALDARRIALELSLISGRGQSVLADMTHLGYTILSGADALVTWDESDLARERTRFLVDVYCRRRNLLEPLIGTPLEISSWLDFEIR